MILKKVFIPVAIVLIIQACSTLTKTANKPAIVTNNSDTLRTIESIQELPVYKVSATRLNDIVHTKLKVNFDWDKQFMYGKATLTVKPYFYPTSILDLNARGMEIKQITLITSSGKIDLKYIYTDDIIHIDLGKMYKNTEEYVIFIDYISKPNLLKKAGASDAIKDNKGLYFINPLGKEKDKPQQIWTQGETQSNSVWFPTIDQPNERMTQDIYITTEKKYVTLSNGDLVSSFDNGNGTRTDCWKMDLPHAPYLAMMAIGEFAIVKDKWRGKEVNYYVEKEYEPYARAIFGRTPEMMEFFSKKLGVPYQWNKYSQVVVRDYVSGAMENTTATLHSEILQQTDRELLDKNYETYIAHELFHQWFGDLVTCESWSNLSLNESFATYGEYLWYEFKYGVDAADEHSQELRDGYLTEYQRKREPLIRFQYDNNEDLFDAHSYNKGEQVLHMLRKYIGDEAFFESLKLYLETNKFKSAEIHNLRLAFEQVTGEDLNWFFNQWFLLPGHPEIIINTSYDSVNKKQEIEIKQIQDFTKLPLFEIPMYIDIYSNGNVDRKKVKVAKANELFYFDAAQRPDLVNVDAEKMLLCSKTEIKTIQEWVFQYEHAPLYLDRYEALVGLTMKAEDSISSKIIISALNDKFWSIRKKAIAALKYIKPGREIEIKNKLIALSRTDEMAIVRKDAIDYLSANYTDNELYPLYKSCLNDRSYGVSGAALMAIAKIDLIEGMKASKKFETEKNIDLLSVILSIYAANGADENNDFFIKASDQFKNYSKIGFINQYSQFISKVKQYETLDSGISFLVTLATNENTDKWTTLYVKKAIKSLENNFSERIKIDLQKLKLLDMNSPSAEKKGLQDKLQEDEIQKQKISDAYNRLK